jgi:3-oxoacyl-[acyl-carrier-protein] synthase-1
MATINQDLRTVLLGDSIVSPLGFTAEENYQKVLQGQTALKAHQFGFSGQPYWAGVIAESKIDTAFRALGNPNDFSKLEKMSILAIEEALKKSNIDITAKDTQLIYCTTKGNIDLLDEEKQHNVPSQRVLLPELAKTIADFLGMANKPIVISSACISGLLGIIIADRFLRQGKWKNIIVAAGDLVSEFTLSGFGSFNALDDETCKPFGKNRKGINIGEAAAALVLTRAEQDDKHTIQVTRGAVSNDANHISAPSRTGDGLYQCINKVLQDKDASVTTPDFISAHGTATVYNDAMESWAIHRASLSDIPMHSLKPYFGHTLGASGLLESILAVYSLRNNELIPIKGFSESGVPKTINPIREKTEKPLNSCLKTSSGFGGCNAAVLFQKMT